MKLEEALTRIQDKRPAICLVELAFISNTEDEQLLAARQDDFARGALPII